MLQEGTSLSCWLEASVLMQLWHNIYWQAGLRIFSSCYWNGRHFIQLIVVTCLQDSLCSTTKHWGTAVLVSHTFLERQDKLEEPSCGKVGLIIGLWPRGFWRKIHELLKSFWHFSLFLKLLLPHGCCIALLQHKDSLQLSAGGQSHHLHHGQWAPHYVSKTALPKFGNVEVCLPSTSPFASEGPLRSRFQVQTLVLTLTQPPSWLQLVPFSYTFFLAKTKKSSKNISTCFLQPLSNLTHDETSS